MIQQGGAIVEKRGISGEGGQISITPRCNDKHTIGGYILI
jgi:hypothetical protein